MPAALQGWYSTPAPSPLFSASAGVFVGMRCFSVLLHRQVKESRPGGFFLDGRQQVVEVSALISFPVDAHAKLVFAPRLVACGCPLRFFYSRCSSFHRSYDPQRLGRVMVQKSITCGGFEFECDSFAAVKQLGTAGRPENSHLAYSC